MAAGQLSKPGSKFGPCKTACQHRDCAEARAMAATACRICAKPIGFGVLFYQEGTIANLVHEECAAKEIEAAV